MHLAGLAVEAQLQHLVAVLDRQRLGADGALHAGDALGLLRAQAEREAHAVLGDHQAGVAERLVALVGGLDDLDAVAGVEVACLRVVDIGQVAERVVGIGHGRRDLGPARLAHMGVQACGFQLLEGVAAQRVEHARRHEPRPARRQHDVGGVGAEDRRAQLAQVLAQRGLALDGIACRLLLRQRDLGADRHAGLVAHRQRQPVRRVVEPHRHADAPLGRLLLQQPHPVHVAVAAELGVAAQVGIGVQRLLRDHAPEALLRVELLCGVDRQAGQLLLQRVVGQGVVVVERIDPGVELHVQMVLADAHHPAQRQAGVLRGVEGADVVLAAVDEIVGAAAVEVAVRIGREGEAGAAGRRGVQLRAAFEQAVEQLAVMGGDVLHVAHVLVAALDLEAADAGVDQRLEVGALVVVLHRQHMLVVRDDAPQRVGHGVGQAAGLRAVAAVGAAAGLGVADIALAGIGHAQRAVHEELQRRAVDLRRHRADLFQREFACQHDLREAGVLQEARLLGRADVGLRRGVQVDRRQVEFQQAHVLHDQRVGAGLVHLADHAACGLQLVVAQDGVERHEDAAAEAVRMLHQPLDVGHRVAGRGPRAEGRAADVDRVRAVVDRLDADVGVASGGEQFDVGTQGHGGGSR